MAQKMRGAIDAWEACIHREALEEYEEIEMQIIEALRSDY